MFTLASTTMTARPALRARVTKRETTKRIIVPKSTANSQSVQRMAPVKTETREVAQVAAKAVAPPPPSKCVSEAQFVQAVTIAFGFYSLQMLLVPAKMITDHFNATADQLTQFWIRGTAVFSLAALYCWTLMPVAAAAKVALWVSAGCGLLYPWNAKFNLMKHNLSIKYPMHYVPEILMAVLTLVGTYVVYL